jgi:hypothetical protein
MLSHLIHEIGLSKSTLVVDRIDEAIGSLFGDY